MTKRSWTSRTRRHCWIWIYSLSCAPSIRARVIRVSPPRRTAASLLPPTILTMARILSPTRSMRSSMRDIFRCRRVLPLRRVRPRSHRCSRRRAYRRHFKSSMRTSSIRWTRRTISVSRSTSPPSSASSHVGVVVRVIFRRCSSVRAKSARPCTSRRRGPRARVTSCN